MRSEFQKAAGLNSNPGAQANYIASSLQSVDVTKCPADFQMAFQVHAFAWQQAVASFANNSVGTAFFEGLAAGATDDPRFIGQAGDQAAYAAQQINQTYLLKSPPITGLVFRALLWASKFWDLQARQSLHPTTFACGSVLSAALLPSWLPNPMNIQGAAPTVLEVHHRGLDLHDG